MPAATIERFALDRLEDLYIQAENHRVFLGEVLAPITEMSKEPSSWQSLNGQQKRLLIQTLLSKIRGWMDQTASFLCISAR